MSAEHQIATDDERRDDLSSPVAESREAAMLRIVAQDFRDLAEAADIRARDAVRTVDRLILNESARVYRFAAAYNETAADNVKAAGG